MKTATLAMRWIVMTACASMNLAAVASGGDDDAAKPDLQRRIAELEAKSARDEARNAELEARISSLENDKDGLWLTQQRATEIRQLVQDVLADADTRASTLGAIAAGYDNGFVISSADGNWLVRTNLLFQERIVINRQTDSPIDDSRWGFENSRTKFILTGNVISPEWFYKVEIEIARANAGFPTGENRTGLEDAYAGYDFGQGWRFWVGTFKTPLLREELVDSAHQLAVERSVVNYLFTGGRTDGLAVEYRNNQFHLIGSYNNGINDVLYGGSVLTGGTDPIITPAADFAATVRGEWLLCGEWSSLNQFTSPPGGSEHAVMLGGAAHYQISHGAGAGATDLNLLVLTGDITAKFSRISLFGAVMYANADPSSGEAANIFGIVVQGGYYFADTWEGFLRYEWSDTDTLASSDISILTIGLNKYIFNQNAKWSTDFGIAFDTVPFAVPITGWRADSPDADNQFVVRSQLQILF